MSIEWIQIGLLLLAAAASTLVAWTRDPLEQIFPMSFLGLVLGLLYFTLEAPDVALSEIVVAGVALPAMTLLALAKAREYEEEQEAARSGAARDGTDEA